MAGDDLVGQVIDNVLLNAVEHNDTERPWVRVTARATDGTVVGRVADNGPGIPEKFRGDIFSPGVTPGESGTIDKRQSATRSGPTPKHPDRVSEPPSDDGFPGALEIGRASCRERV